MATYRIYSLTHDDHIAGVPEVIEYDFGSGGHRTR